jgi:hypothetical protein
MAAGQDGPADGGSGAEPTQMIVLNGGSSSGKTGIALLPGRQAALTQHGPDAAWARRRSRQVRRRAR